jgi:hypothetical protein
MAGNTGKTSAASAFAGAGETLLQKRQWESAGEGLRGAPIRWCRAPWLKKPAGKPS